MLTFVWDLSCAPYVMSCFHARNCVQSWRAGRRAGEGIVHRWRSQRTMGTFSPSLSSTSLGNFLIVSYSSAPLWCLCVCVHCHRSSGSAMWSKMIIVADSSLNARMCNNFYEKSSFFPFLLEFFFHFHSVADVPQLLFSFSFLFFSFVFDLSWLVCCDVVMWRRWTYIFTYAN